MKRKCAQKGKIRWRQEKHDEYLEEQGSQQKGCMAGQKDFVKKKRNTLSFRI
jgi:hypothetical protein